MATKHKKLATRPPLLLLASATTTWREVSPQASKNKSLKDIEEQHKKAFEEAPFVSDYAAGYDEMKEKVVHPRIQDREERKAKWMEYHNFERNKTLLIMLKGMKVGVKADAELKKSIERATEQAEVKKLKN